MAFRAKACPHVMRGGLRFAVREVASKQRIEPGSETIRTDRGSRRCAVSVTQQQVLDALAKVRSPARRRLDRRQCAVGGHRSATARCSSRSMSMPRRPVPGKAFGPTTEAAVRAHSRRHRRHDRADRRTQTRLAGSPRRDRRRIAIRTACNPSRRIARRKVRLRRCRSSRRFPALPPLSRWPPARAASANRPPRSIWHWACAISVCGSACSMPTSMGRRCRG